MASEVHADLARKQSIAQATPGLQLFRLYLKVPTDPLSDPFDGRAAGIGFGPKEFRHSGRGQRLCLQPSQDLKESHSPFQLPDTAV